MNFIETVRALLVAEHGKTPQEAVALTERFPDVMSASLMEGNGGHYDACVLALEMAESDAKASKQTTVAKPKRWKVVRRFDIYEDTQDGGGGGRYIGTTRGNWPMPTHIAERDEANAILMAASLTMLAALQRQHANIQQWLAGGPAAGPEESREIAEQIQHAIEEATMLASPTIRFAADKPDQTGGSV